ncbi:MAG: rhodanese-like domain-containing protein [Candidatus Heimdallarchaeota archaeon]
MSNRMLKKFRWLYIIDKFMKIFVNRFRTGRWITPEITPEELFEDINANQAPLLIYVLRIYGEEGLIENALTIPTPKLISYADKLQAYKDKKVVIICGGGGMSMAGTEIMIDAGFTDVWSLNGGMELWAKKGYPTVQTDQLQQYKLR